MPIKHTSVTNKQKFYNQYLSQNGSEIRENYQVCFTVPTLKKELATKLCTTFLMEKKGKHNYTTPFPAHRAGEAVLEAATNPLRLTTK